ncbi:MAG TPA: hypothetical protein VFX48_02235 [Saprospiraceae bacterium]|nr:hypothetical protein [Saprospiraceae bacterium]
MSLISEARPALNPDQWLIWVLAPYLKTEDPNLQYYYDFSQSIQEYTRVFEELGLEWKWQPVYWEDYRNIISGISKASRSKTPLVLNLCDGDEFNQVPGISVIDELEKNHLIYTGSSRIFYEATTSKIPMKTAFDQLGVPTAAWKVIDPAKLDAPLIFEELKAPLIVKPAVSAGSMGLGIHSVVHDPRGLIDYLENVIGGYKGWDLASGGLFAEEFIDGEEYTTLIVGPGDQQEACTVFIPVERVFENSLPATEKFLSFDRLWEIYEKESPLDEEKDLWNYARPDEQLIEEIKRISLMAYCAVHGTGYGRVDLRRDHRSGKIMVLEVNAQCGLSDDENYTSIGAILRFSGYRYSQLISDILQDAVRRYRHSNKDQDIPANARSKQVLHKHSK